MMRAPVHPIYFAEISNKPFDLPKTAEDVKKMSQSPIGLDDSVPMVNYDVTWPELIVKHRLQAGDYPPGADGTVGVQQRNTWLREAVIEEDPESIHYTMKIIMCKHDNGRDHFVLESEPFGSARLDLLRSQKFTNMEHQGRMTGTAPRSLCFPKGGKTTNSA